MHYQLEILARARHEEILREVQQLTTGRQAGRRLPVDPRLRLLRQRHAR